MRPLDTDPAEHLLDLPETHAAVVQQDRQLDDLAIRALTLEKLNLIKHLIQRGKIQLHQLL